VTNSDEPSSSLGGPIRRRIFRWPLFCVLGVLHIGVLPLVLSEKRDDVLAVVAGFAYLTLAALDWRYPNARWRRSGSR
jgi:hypothetical protein